MKTVQISLNSIGKVKSFVNAITQFDFDFDLISGRYVIDAKSIMGIFSLDLSKPIDLAIHTETNLDEIMEVLEKDPDVLGCYLSGAGPTLMAVIKEEDKMGVVRIKEELGSLLNDWDVLKLELDHRGYTCDYE